MSQKKIAILGAGPSGLAQLRAFEAARLAGVKDLPEIVCYEKQDDIGGMWNYTWRTGLDRNGEPVHGSMYRYLWSNGPKECLEFADYSFEEHFGQAIPSYPPREVLKDYIMGRINNQDIRKYIRFESPIRWVTFDDDTRKFTVTVMNHKTEEQEAEEFDYVVVATGHFSTPNMPYFEGLEEFPNRVLHAHDFRDALEFEGQDILLVGSSYSAEDIGTQCYKYGTNSVTISYRSTPLGYDWPEGIKEVPCITHFEGDVAHFADGTAQRFDAVIMCTGYLFHFPFLPDELRLQTHNCLYPANLYKGIFWQPNPQLIYLGMQDQYFTFNMFDAQAWYARDVILGDVELPDLAMREQDEQKWLAEYEHVHTVNSEIDFQAKYIRDLTNATDYPEFAVEKQGDIFKEWQKDKVVDIMGFREKAYRSTLTNTLAPELPEPWLDILDDSLEHFLNLTFIESKKPNKVSYIENKKSRKVS
ncbi:NAD(P)/FAD-dependent oxidoreductase [Psychrobacter frigidicola]|uniref:Trimethylamine monooxygenase n=1 Tax=Psychrobacter frigidicola TaxID=45611 RepID=A0A5C7A9Q1_9GAMM|nr:NAD(P)/FAD-dependent oxidoreductase [Psychrobacter frigidicola]TXD97473.1 NAD(P)/FAD-dependent oxidoreductase [Psychrobacter frigidicola]